MPDEVTSFQSPPPELLFATFTTAGVPADRNPEWVAVLGDFPDTWSYLSIEDREPAQRLVMEAATGILVNNQVFTVVHPGREEPLPVLFNFYPVRSIDHCVVAVMVTAEVLAEPQTWTASQTQRNRLESLGRMAMGIAHDFNNLLSSVLGHTELMKLAIIDRIPGQLEEHLRMMEQAALDGAGLVRKIQQYVRKEKRQRYEPLDMPTLIRDVVALTRPYWFNEPRRKGISIHTRLNLEPVVPVMGSATELREVLVNLILNAVQAMPQGGEIAFETFGDEHGVRIRVRDSGVGMADSVQRRIFEPLFTTKGEHGTGMGLAVTYGIIQEHEGTIEVDSILGKGTTFTVILPGSGIARELEVAEPVVGTVEPVEILVVDDDQAVLSVLCRLLTLKGHRVTGAASGAEGLMLGAQHRFDIVFTDHGMPEMNGRQFASAFKAQHPRTPVVLLTGDTEPGEPDASIDCVLSKPFKIEKLQGTILHLVTHGTFSP